MKIIKFSFFFAIIIFLFYGCRTPGQMMLDNAYNKQNEELKAAWDKASPSLKKELEIWQKYNDLSKENLTSKIKDGLSDLYILGTGFRGKCSTKPIPDGENLYFGIFDGLMKINKNEYTKIYLNSKYIGQIEYGYMRLHLKPERYEITFEKYDTNTTIGVELKSNDFHVVASKIVKVGLFKPEIKANSGWFEKLEQKWYVLHRDFECLPIIFTNDNKLNSQTKKYLDNLEKEAK